MRLQRFFRQTIARRRLRASGQVILGVLRSLRDQKLEMARLLAEEQAHRTQRDAHEQQRLLEEQQQPLAAERERAEQEERELALRE